MYIVFRDNIYEIILESKLKVHAQYKMDKDKSGEFINML